MSGFLFKKLTNKSGFSIFLFQKLNEKARLDHKQTPSNLSIAHYNPGIILVLIDEVTPFDCESNKKTTKTIKG
ncbi:MAG: hypothetical protein QM786_19855 [Breznakibacter sp.]